MACQRANVQVVVNLTHCKEKEKKIQSYIDQGIQLKNNSDNTFQTTENSNRFFQSEKKQGFLLHIIQEFDSSDSGLKVMLTRQGLHVLCSSFELVVNSACTGYICIFRPLDSYMRRGRPPAPQLYTEWKRLSHSGGKMSKNNDISVFCGATLSALNLSIDQVWQKDDRVKITFELKRVMEE